MPGITGVFGLHEGDESTSLIHRMSQPMLHEDFYTSGTYLNRELGIVSAFVSADSAPAPGLAWNQGGGIGCFISGEPVIGSPDANSPGSRGHRLASEASSPWSVSTRNSASARLRN